MKIVCIKKYRSTSLMYELTYGKTYETVPFKGGLVQLKYPDRYYQVVNDRGHLEYYSKNTFVTLDDWREIKINEIINGTGN